MRTSLRRSIELGKKSILDGLGPGPQWFESRNLGTDPGVCESLSAFPQAAGAAVLGSAVRFPARFAAFANGVAIHVDDFDDTQLAVCQRPRLRVTRASDGLRASRCAGNGRDWGKERQRSAVAYQAGVEVECKIAEAISPRHYEDGFHSTGTCGVFGGTAGLRQAQGAGRGRTLRVRSELRPAMPRVCAKTSAR